MFGLRPFSILVLIVGLILGGLGGAVVHSTLFSGREATAIVKVGRVANVGSLPTAANAENTIERPDVLAERLKYPDFGRDAEKASGVANAASLLPSRQYGGQGKLKTRVLKDNVQIEVRVEGNSSEQALALANAVCTTLIQQHDAIFKPLYSLMIDRAEALKDTIKLLESSDKTVVSTMAAGGTEASSVPTFSMLLAVKAQMVKDLSENRKLLVELEADLLPPNSVATHVVSAPAISKPVLGSAFALVLVGAIAGGGLGLVVLLLRRANA